MIRGGYPEPATLFRQYLKAHAAGPGYESRIEKRWLGNLKNVMTDVGAKQGMLLYSGEDSFEASEGIRVQSASKAGYLAAALPD